MLGKSVYDLCEWKKKNIGQYIGMFHITKYQGQYQSKKSFIAQTLHKMIDQT